MNEDLKEERFAIDNIVQNACSLAFEDVWRRNNISQFSPTPFTFRDAPKLSDAEEKVGGVPEKSFTEMFSKRRKH